MQIDPLVLALAQQVTSGQSWSCGLDTNVVLAQWESEEFINSPNWPGNNPAGITAGNSEVDALSNGTTSGGFLAFPTPAIGAKAYSLLYQTDSNYAAVRQAIQTGNPINELNAIIQSPWDASHYGNGERLYANYNAITGQNNSVPSGLTYTSTNYTIQTTSSTPQISFPATNYSVLANSQRFGNVLYGRRYRVLVSNAQGVALDVSDLHVAFNIQTVVNQTPPFSTATIYNLNVPTENFLLEYGAKVIIEAGYVGSQYGQIFEGDLIEPIRDKPDNVTYRLTLNCLAANRQLNQAFAAFTLNRLQSARSQTENLLSKATVATPLGDISPNLSQATLPRGKVVFGLTRKYLRQIAQANDATFYADHTGAINIVKANDPPKGDIIYLTPESGLIGQPVQQDLGVSFKCLLNPAITINSLVHIDNAQVQAQTFNIGSVQRALDPQGIYRVIGVTQVGDSRGQDWYTECQTVSQAGGIPGMISSTTGNPWG